MSVIQLEIRLEMPLRAPSSTVEEIEDLVASILARHGFAGEVYCRQTGNSTRIQYRPVDDGRGYPRRRRGNYTRV